MGKALNYRRELDGLRAIALIPVILFHAGFELFSGGYVGVDVFFVISGYLITTILMREIDKNGFSVLKFYERRLRRLLPALFLVIAVSAVAGWYILMPSDFLDFCESIMAVIFGGSNILFWTESSYWDTSSDLKPLLHTWSLAVEEQYYLLFPPFLYIFYRRSKKITYSLVVLVFLISLVLSQILSIIQPTANFYLLPSRAWELMLGSITAFLLSNNQIIHTIGNTKWMREVFSVLGISMICVSVFSYDHHTPNPSLMMLLPTVGTTLIILFCYRDTLVAKILCVKPMVLVGLISYSAYLWHQPIFAYARYLAFPEQSKLLFGVLSVSVLPLAYLTWKYVEAPFRNNEKIKTKSIFTGALVCSVILFAFGMVGYASKGFKGRGLYQNLLIKNYQPDNTLLRDESWKKLRDMSGDEEYGVDNNEYDKTLWFNSDDKRLKLLIVGNSHSKDMYNLLGHSKSVQANFELARFGVQVQDILKNQQDFFDSPNYVNSNYVMICSLYSKKATKSLEAVVKRFLADNKKVIIVRSIHQFSSFGTSTLGDKIVQRFANDIFSGVMQSDGLAELINKEYYNESKTGVQAGHIIISDKVIDDIKNHYNVIILDRKDYASDDGGAVYYAIDKDLHKYNYDATHHTIEGARFYGSRVDEVKWLNELFK